MELCILEECYANLEQPFNFSVIFPVCYQQDYTISTGFNNFM